MPVPIRYNLRSLFYRKTATLLTLLAIALTVSVLVIMLSVAAGFRHSMSATGRADNRVCLRVGATSEGESTITRDEANTIGGFSGIALDDEGKPLVASEMYAGVTLPRVGGDPKNDTTNVPLRGVSLTSFKIRDGVKVVSGRKFNPGAREVVVGRGLVDKIRGCQLGGTVRISKDPWDVVGIMEAGGTAFDSEIWGDAELLLQVFDRPFYSAIYFRQVPGTDAKALQQRLGVVHSMSEPEYFEKQSGFLGGVLTGLAFMLTTLMSIGALAGCTNTLLAAVAGRTREIGGLLAIGYRPFHVFLGFLLEALALALIGGLLGVLVAFPFNGVGAGTTNWQTFTEQAFRFRIDAGVVMTAMTLALVIGLIGGSLPAWRASRLKPVDALRRG